jgi:hypothetical protein
MNCPCDQLIFPPPQVIPAGLPALPRQIASFPEFREAMLARILSEPALVQWRARRSDDFGVMLLEMWAYVCDSISFYDEVIADESYVRTASLRPSLRKLVALLGYIPRPAVAAGVDLALLVEGRQPFVVPAGTQFRSGAFPGGAPQIFEVAADTRVHPFLNRWVQERARRATLTPGPPYLADQSLFLADAKTNRLKAEQIVLVEDLADESLTQARIVKAVSDFTGQDGAKYKSIQLDSPVPISGAASPDSVRLLAPAQTGTIWQNPWDGWFSGLLSDGVVTYVIFDTLHRDINLNDNVVLDKAGDMRWFTVVRMGETQGVLPSSGSTTVNNVTVAVTSTATLTWIELDADVNDPSRKAAGAPDWTIGTSTAGPGDAAYIKVHFGFRTAAVPTTEMLLTLNPNDPMILTPPVEAPQDGKSPGVFLLHDHDDIGAEISGGIEFDTRTLTPSPALSAPLAAPVEVYGNVVSATHGETVNAEILGSGDASQNNQTFKLKKSPLTYLPGVDAPSSTLKIYVHGLLWSETPSFFGMAPDAQVYIVRQNDAGDSFVTFGDGIRGSRLTTGSGNVVAYYRYGAGKASPPAGSITQMGKPVKGISSVRNPVAAGGGDDAEPASGLRTYAPRSALLLGRAISLADMEAAAAAVGGVRAVRCEWRWNIKRQRPLVEVYYIGAASVAQNVVKKLRGLSDSVTPIEVDQATALPSVLSLSIEIDPRRLEADVLAAVRSALMDPASGILAPEHVGIGLALFESRVFDAVLAVPGAVAVHGLLLNGSIFKDYGVVPGAGKYFDFETGALVLNGKAA